MTYFAHSIPNASTDKWQSLADHLLAVANLARRHADKFGAGPWGEASGLLHDVGKYSDAFQARLAGDPSQVDHSTAGAQIARRHYGIAGNLIAAGVAGHHAGLANGTEPGERTPLAARLTAPVAHHSAWQREITLPALAAPTLTQHPAAGPDRIGFQLAHLGRMIFSCLVDADFADTERFYSEAEGWSVERGNWKGLDALKDQLAAYLVRKVAGVEQTTLNQLRTRILEHARAQARMAPGVFSLTVPTGGGKTLTSLAFALDHALSHGLDRIIYVIPYTSIIEQTSDVFREALGPLGDHVVEHHSAYHETPPRAGRAKLRLAAENWDAPIIVTTAVQFFESLFSDRPSRCRKLHNIVRSVVILDEAQTLPLPLLRPCVAVLDELVRNYRSTIVLCTATQPALAERPDDLPRSFSGGFREVREIAPEPAQLFAQLRRVTVRHVGALRDLDLAAAMRDGHQVLTIVNSRRHARELFAAVGETDGAAHLSALMCPQHRSERLADVKRRLLDNLPVRLVATAVIEAGVDIDFLQVFRAMAGLDQIAQAAGRCNREGRWPAERSTVTVFEPDAPEPQYLRKAASAARDVLRHHTDNPMSLDAVDAYFRRLYWGRTLGGDGLDVPAILPRLNVRRADLLIPYEAIARDMRLIPDGTEAIIIPWDDNARQLLADLENADRVGAIARRLQRYVVTVYPKDFDRLRDAGAIEPVAAKRLGDQFWTLTDAGRYDADMGLDIWKQA